MAPENSNTKSVIASAYQNTSTASVVPELSRTSSGAHTSTTTKIKRNKTRLSTTNRNIFTTHMQCNAACVAAHSEKDARIGEQGALIALLTRELNAAHYKLKSVAEALTPVAPDALGAPDTPDDPAPRDAQHRFDFDAAVSYIAPVNGRCQHTRADGNSTRVCNQRTRRSFCRSCRLRLMRRARLAPQAMAWFVRENGASAHARHSQ